MGKCLVMIRFYKFFTIIVTQLFIDDIFMGIVAANSILGDQNFDETDTKLITGMRWMTQLFFFFTMQLIQDVVIKFGQWNLLRDLLIKLSF